MRRHWLLACLLVVLQRSMILTNVEKSVRLVPYGTAMGRTRALCGSGKGYTFFHSLRRNRTRKPSRIFGSSGSRLSQILTIPLECNKKTISPSIPSTLPQARKEAEIWRQNQEKERKTTGVSAFCLHALPSREKKASLRRFPKRGVLGRRAHATTKNRCSGGSGAFGRHDDPRQRRVGIVERDGNGRVSDRIER